ncbi:T9SS type A sorting domain-containing protein [Algibacter sp. 2305UL17-15]|uniref:T9SS type A sorting domain-containing protein n=1 Tax=Algibacter sp. 2305UL17-15 TaxID=3231268 RepID=UPI00345B3053
MKKITLLFVMFALMVCTTSLTAQTYYSASLNGSTDYVSNPGSFADYPWGTGIPNYSFDNVSANSITIVIKNYDETNPAVGPELFINWSRSGFGTAPLGWGSDNFTNLKTLVPADFTAGEATVVVSIPAGTKPVEMTDDYESGYKYILQVVGANPPTNQTYVNFVSTIEEEILSTNDFNKNKLAAFYSSSKDAVVISNSTVIGSDYKVYDLTGRTIKTGKVSNEISVSTLKTGLYILATDKGVLKFAK